MRELFRERDLTVVYYYRTMLESAGIATFIRNENLSSVEGVSIPEFFPALCIVNDLDHEEAISLLKEHHESTKEAAPGLSEEVICAACGEHSPGNFESCWNCEGHFSRH